jgi:hypothetical protein
MPEFGPGPIAFGAIAPATSLGDLHDTLGLIKASAGYPGRGGGEWLRMIFPAGLVAWLVPSGCTRSSQPSWCSSTW